MHCIQQSHRHFREAGIFTDSYTKPASRVSVSGQNPLALATYVFSHEPVASTDLHLSCQPLRCGFRSDCMEQARGRLGRRLFRRFFRVALA